MRCKKKRAGLTLVEVLITVVLFAVVGIFASMITLTVAKRSRNALTEVPSDQQVYRTVDHVRLNLLPAKYTTITISDDAKSVFFHNPARKIDGQILFNDDDRQCVYIPDILTPEYSLLCGKGVSGRFEWVDNGRMVRVIASTIVQDHDKGPITISYQDDLRVRN
jgi:Prokaryotic N-terminal methylation motif